MIKQAYINGFMRKCAQLGVDGRKVIRKTMSKRAGWWFRRPNRSPTIEEAKKIALERIKRYAGSEFPDYSYTPALDVLRYLGNKHGTLRHIITPGYFGLRQEDIPAAELYAASNNSAGLKDSLDKLMAAKYISGGGSYWRDALDTRAVSTAFSLENLAKDVKGNPREKIDIEQPGYKSLVDSAADELGHFPTTPEGTNTLYSALSGMLSPKQYPRKHPQSVYGH